MLLFWSMQQRSLVSTLYRYKAHHILFWSSYFIFWVLFYKAQYASLWSICFVTFQYTLFHALCFYLVGYRIIPRYLTPKRVGLFFLYSLLIVLATSLGLATTLFLTFSFLIRNNTSFPFASIFFVSFGSNVSIAGVLVAVKLIVDRVRSERRLRELENQQLAAELQYLKAQVNPHFLFNAINSVYFLIKKDPHKAAETLIKLSDLLRFQLYDCSDEKIPIEKEIEYLNNFITLEKLRKGDKVTVHYQQDGNLNGFLIAPFMLIPFLENAFKFISNYKEKPNEIHILLKRDEERLTACFKNTYEEIPRNGVGGIGLKNVKRRLDLLYPQKHLLQIDHHQETYSVTLTLDL